MTQQEMGIGNHLISTNTSSSHVQSLLKNGNACLYFSDPAKFETLCLSGRAEDRTFTEHGVEGIRD